MYWFSLAKPLYTPEDTGLAPVAALDMDFHAWAYCSGKLARTYSATSPDPSNTIVKAFTSDSKTQEQRDFVLRMFEVNLLLKCPSLPDGVWTDVDLATVVPAVVLNQGFSFSGPTIPTLPGLLAGGISGSDAGMDSRNVSGTVQMLRTVVNGKTTSVRVRTRFRFVVRDAIDFCPGDPGGRLAQSITIPMSRLEVNGDAYDLPFEVHYDAPVLERDLNGAALYTCFGQ